MKSHQLKNYTLALLQSAFAYLFIFIGGALLLPAGDISVRECVLRDGGFGLILCLTATLIQTVLRPLIFGGLCGGILVFGFLFANAYPNSVVSKLLFM